MSIYKISAGETLDAFYDEDPVEALSYAGELLGGPASDSVLGAAESFADDGNISSGAVVDLQESWLEGIGDVPGEDVDRILRLGYREAIAIALTYDPPVPIESFWVTRAGAELEMHISAGPQRVVVFISTPVVRNYGSRRATSQSWTVRIGDLSDIHADAPREQLDDDPNPVLKIQVSGPFDGPAS